MAGLPGTVQIEITDALLAAYTTRNDVAVLFKRIGRSYDRDEIPNIAFGKSVLAVVGTASTEGWLPKLLREAASERPADPALAEWASWLAAVEPVEEGPASAGAAGDQQLMEAAVGPTDQVRRCRLSGGYYLVDREPLRNAMVELLEPTGQRILLVTGDGGSGKSYTRRLIWHLEDALGSFGLVDIDLDVAAEQLTPRRPFLPVDIARMIVDGFGYANFDLPPLPDDKAWARWNLDFAEAFQRRALPDRTRRWIVLDGFNKVDATDDVRDLVAKLALRVSERLSRVRLVLVGFGSELPSPVRPTVRPESVPWVDQPHVAGFAVSFLDEISSPLGVAERVSRCTEFTVSVMAGLEPGKPGYMAALNQRVTAEIGILTKDQP